MFPVFCQEDPGKAKMPATSTAEKMDILQKVIAVISIFLIDSFVIFRMFQFQSQADVVF